MGQAPLLLRFRWTRKPRNIHPAIRQGKPDQATLLRFSPFGEQTRLVRLSPDGLGQCPQKPKNGRGRPPNAAARWGVGFAFRLPLRNARYRSQRTCEASRARMPEDDVSVCPFRFMDEWLPEQRGQTTENLHNYRCGDFLQANSILPRTLIVNCLQSK